MCLPPKAHTGTARNRWTKSDGGGFGGKTLSGALFAHPGRWSRKGYRCRGRLESDGAEGLSGLSAPFRFNERSICAARARATPGTVPCPKVPHYPALVAKGETIAAPRRRAEIAEADVFLRIAQQAKSSRLSTRIAEPEPATPRP